MADNHTANRTAYFLNTIRSSSFFYFKAEVEPSFRNVVFYNFTIQMMDKVQENNLTHNTLVLNLL